MRLIHCCSTGKVYIAATLILSAAAMPTDESKLALTAKAIANLRLIWCVRVIFFPLVITPGEFAFVSTINQ
jgi:hypothetical protein